MMLGTTSSVLLIAGMRTIACSEKIATAIGSVAGVTKANVNFWSARATVVHRSQCNTSQLIRAVQEAGYGASLSAGTESDCREWLRQGITAWNNDGIP